MDQSEIEKLVCKSCWQDFSSTDAFWETCNSEPGAYLPPSTTLRALNNTQAMPPDKCNWCVFLKINFQYNTDAVVDVKFLQSHCWIDAPSGRNNCQVLTERSSCDVFTFSDADDNCAAYVTARPVQTNMSTQSTFDQMKGCLWACDSHGSCSPQHDVALPTRVIQVSPRQTPTQPRIL